jgi:hypothetical protein
VEGGVSGRERTEERLEAAGWERWRPQDLRVVFWRNPKDGLWHAQGEAIALLEGRPVGHGDAVTSQEEARALEEAGWEPRGGPKTLWRNPSSGQWYAHRQAVIMVRGEGTP